MKINWRVRLKNPVWWVHIFVSMAMPVIAYYGMSAQDFTSWGVLWHTVVEALENPYVIGCALVGAWNAVYDPTSKGLTDCRSVMCQTKPR